VQALEKKQEIMGEGAEQAKSFIEAAKGDIPGMMEKFHADMNREVDEARRILTNQSRKISIEIAEKLLGRSLQ
jgi:F-type H+-transporting ATPase subunit b